MENRLGAGKPKISKAQARQHQQRLADEKIQAQEQGMRNEVKATLRASWNESLEEVSERKILVKKTEEIQREVVLANKALVMVRRAQLKQLLEEEWREYETEFHDLGLAFHRDRL